MNSTLSKLILELHQTAQRIPPHLYCDWLFSWLKKHFNIHTLYWCERDYDSPESSITARQEQKMLTKFNRPESYFRAEALNKVPSQFKVSGTAQLALCQRTHELVFVTDHPLNSVIREWLNVIIPHIVEANDTSYLIYLSKLQNSNFYALLSDNGTVKHISKFAHDLLKQLKTEINLSQDELIFLNKYKVSRLGSIFIKKTGEYQGQPLIQIATTPTRLNLLTPVEFSVSYHYSRGLTYKEVAKVVGISPSTVNNHLNKIFQKLQLKNKNKLSLEFIE